MTSDGTIALIGEPADDDYVGGAWIFTRNSSGNWNQVGTLLQGSNAIGASGQGYSVSLNRNATIVVTGGPFDNSADGAVWLFRPEPSTIQPTASPSVLK